MTFCLYLRVIIDFSLFDHSIFARYNAKPSARELFGRECRFWVSDVDVSIVIARATSLYKV